MLKGALSHLCCVAVITPDYEQEGALSHLLLYGSKDTRLEIAGCTAPLLLCMETFPYRFADCIMELLLMSVIFVA